MRFGLTPVSLAYTVTSYMLLGAGLDQTKHRTASSPAAASPVPSLDRGATPTMMLVRCAAAANRSCVSCSPGWMSPEPCGSASVKAWASTSLSTAHPCWLSAAARGSHASADRLDRLASCVCVWWGGGGGVSQSTGQASCVKGLDRHCVLCVLCVLCVRVTRVCMFMWACQHPFPALASLDHSVHKPSG
jgi:hypothetical protein